MDSNSSGTYSEMFPSYFSSNTVVESRGRRYHNTRRFFSASMEPGTGLSPSPLCHSTGKGMEM